MYATFQTEDGSTYTLTEQDVLWLSVALYGETRGGHSSKEWINMMYCWLNRFMLHEGQAWPTLASLIKNHSQPVNPKWRRTGSKCTGYFKDKEECEESRLVHRDKMEALLESGDLSIIPGDQMEVINDFVYGTVDAPHQIPYVDFAVTAKAKKYGTQLEPKGNYYLTANQCQDAGIMCNFRPIMVYPVTSMDFTPEEAGMPSQDTSKTTTGVVIILGLAGLGYLAYRMLRR